ncbi:hypothetical protein RM572_00770 [Streptomyces sp. DSM 42041]|uniref:DNA-binding phage zinc finger domain-containing protein n=1 Tax=Streptomyces hazeniae TaxID=3075538 RepID=A0ABU2NK60_9ACTN|nr:hypothetical protein [Streptomyces sp. DSM 42041]MDT0377308.1 hypothetical protein [Streptomyces sp. DSM 42041]
MSTRQPPPLRFPQVAVSCPWCHATPGEPCAVRRRGPRRDMTHQARRNAWVISVAVCPACQVTPGTPCADTNRRPLPEPHPERDAEAVRTQPSARTPRVHALGEQLDLTDEQET